MRPAVAAVGLAPHSGWAALVVLGDAPSSPRVLARSRVEMADPTAPESKHPYHSVEALGIKEASRRLSRYLRVAESNASSAMQSLLEDLSERGYRIPAVGILDSSGRKGGSLESILASHPLIHTAEGEHFRTALAAAAERHGLAVLRVRAKDLGVRAAERLECPLPRLEERVKELGRQVGPPWGADQKRAALLAWLLLYPSK